MEREVGVCGLPFLTQVENCLVFNMTSDTQSCSGNVGYYVARFLSLFNLLFFAVVTCLGVDCPDEGMFGS